MKRSELREIAASQKEAVESLDTGLPRTALGTLPDIRSHALIVSGIRRCGKSTLLHQFTRTRGRSYFYLNFDDLRLLDFTTSDYALLDTIITESGADLLFFDEIQSAEHWELYLRQKLDEQYQIIATGSNASLLSGELGTKLTGRHITKELYPFSYSEFLAFRNKPRGIDSLNEYLERGGFPEYLKTGNPDILTQLQTDILYRDIAVRHGIRDIASLKRLFVYLLSNAANLVSPSKLTQIVGAKSPSTILDYFSHFEAAYLLERVPRFSWSAKAQALAPKKLYIVDPGLIRTGSVAYTKNEGSFLENFIFMELRRLTSNICYFSDNAAECDFIVNAHREKPLCIQVCSHLNHDNEAREIKGLMKALSCFDLAEGYIITAAARDEIITQGKKLHVIPAWEDLAATCGLSR
ncbi:MAG: ATP-binding protein [Rectinema subterraneum]|jgi:predicted AAA+ superfamily ATPase